jgi:hypothetical protein
MAGPSSRAVIPAGVAPAVDTGNLFPDKLLRAIPARVLAIGRIAAGQVGRAGDRAGLGLQGRSVRKVRPGHEDADSRGLLACEGARQDLAVE